MIVRRYFPLAIIALLTSVLTSCELIGDIFEAGMWTGVVIVVLVLALIIWLISRVF